MNIFYNVVILKIISIEQLNGACLENRTVPIKSIIGAADQKRLFKMSYDSAFLF
jgi:hypothetical protein